MAGGREFEGKDLEQALHAAADNLGIAEPDLDYEIVQQGRRGLFGLGARNTRIRVKPPIEELADVDEPRGRERRPRRRRRGGGDRPKANPPDRQRPAAPRRPAPREARGPAVEAERIAEVQANVQQIIDAMNFELTVTGEPADDGVNLHLEGPDRKFLQEKDGELLAAMQFLLNRMARRAWPGVERIWLAGNGQSSGKDGDLVELAREVAQQVGRTGQPKRLHPMNAYERRLVHIAIREYSDLGSRSEGDGYLKRVRIFRQKSGKRPRKRPAPRKS
jgi:spoIIIJ-associated protein